MGAALKFEDAKLFLKEFFRQPRQMGALLPSSRNLASAMARWLPTSPDVYVLELGPGTGAITNVLLKFGLSEDRLLVIERSAAMAKHLRRRFPNLQIILDDAIDFDYGADIPKRWKNNVSMVFSSLPLLALGSRLTIGLAERIGATMRPKARFVQYSYHLGRRSAIPPAQFRILRSTIVWLNIPPARVSVYELVR